MVSSSKIESSRHNQGQLPSAQSCVFSLQIFGISGGGQSLDNGARSTWVQASASSLALNLGLVPEPLCFLLGTIRYNHLDTRSVERLKMHSRPFSFSFLIFIYGCIGSLLLCTSFL